MRKLYGDSLRKDAGFAKVLKKVARSHASRAGRHAPALTSVAREVKGTLDKVYEETAEAVEDFLAKCASPPHPPAWPALTRGAARPRFEEVVQDTKFLLQQSRERLVLTRVAHDVDRLDAAAYALTLPARRFHLGEPVRAAWRAPPSHSRKDWVGLYRVRAASHTVGGG
jgi:phosphatidylethanolamine N-methyltransferase